MTIEDGMKIPTDAIHVEEIKKESIGVEKRIEQSREFNERLKIKDSIDNLTRGLNPVNELVKDIPSKLTRIGNVLRGKGLDSQQFIQAMNQIEDILNDNDLVPVTERKLESDKPVV